MDNLKINFIPKISVSLYFHPRFASNLFDITICPISKVPEFWLNLKHISLVDKNVLHYGIIFNAKKHIRSLRKQCCQTVFRAGSRCATFCLCSLLVASFLYQTSFLARIRHVKIEENSHYSYGLCQEQPSSQDLSFSAQT